MIYFFFLEGIRILKLCLFVCSMVGMVLVGICIEPEIQCSGIDWLSLTWRWGGIQFVFNRSLRVKPCINFPCMAWSDTISLYYSCLYKASSLLVRGYVWWYPHSDDFWGLWWGSILIGWSPYWVSRERWALLFYNCHFTAGYQVNSRMYHLVLWALTCPPYWNTWAGT